MRLQHVLEYNCCLLVLLVLLVVLLLGERTCVEGQMSGGGFHVHGYTYIHTGTRQ